MKYFRYCVSAGCLILHSAALAQTGVLTRKLVAEFRIDGVKKELNKILHILPHQTWDQAMDRGFAARTCRNDAGHAEDHTHHAD